MSKNYHREAIDVLAWDEMKPAEMLRQIAKDSPATLVKAARVLGFTTVARLEDRVKDMLRAPDTGAGTSMFVEAIKLVRAERNLSLKDANDFVDALR